MARFRQLLPDRDDAHFGAVGVLHGHVALARAVGADQDGAQADADPLVAQPRHPVGHLGPRPGRHRLAVEQDRRHQCRKCRSPVTTMANARLVGGRDDLAVLHRPPGCTTAVTPAAARTSSPSGNGKKASLAPAPALGRLPGLAHGDLGGHHP